MVCLLNVSVYIQLACDCHLTLIYGCLLACSGIYYDILICISLVAVDDVHLFAIHLRLADDVTILARLTLIYDVANTLNSATESIEA